MCGKSCGVICMPVAAQATHRVHLEVMPLFAGYLPLPDVRLFKYLPHHSAHASQLDAGRAQGQGSLWGRVAGSGTPLVTAPSQGADTVSVLEVNAQGCHPAAPRLALIGCASQTAG